LTSPSRGGTGSVPEPRRPEGTIDAMISRNTTTLNSITQRQIAMRRLQHQQRSVTARLYCRTNGCTTFMNLDAPTGIASCPICGARRRVD
jgi:hypothetical protein